MRTQFTKLLSLSALRLGILCAFLGTSVPAALAREGPDNSTSPSNSTAPFTQLNWLQSMIDILQEIFVLVGGDPTTDDRAGTADSRISVLMAQYARNGPPQSLSDSGRAEMIQDIRILYWSASPSLNGVSPEAQFALRLLLQKIWADLDMPVSDL
jgi:hypothetical protein